MRLSLFCFLTLLIALPALADGFLPENLPANWRTVDPTDLEGETTEPRGQVRINTDNGDMLIAYQCAHASDDQEKSDSVERMADLARATLDGFWSKETDARITTLRARASELSSVRTSHLRKGAVRGNVTTQPVVVTTFVLESDRGNMMANGISFTKDGQAHVLQHVSTRPISDKLVSRLASWAMHRARPQAIGSAIEP